MKGLIMKKTILLLLITIAIINIAQAATYYVSQSGSDSNTSEQAKSIDTPWQTISRVNYANLQPGDSVLFKRGDIFRGNLIPQSGSSSGYITYGAYSTGEKPKILGSIQKNEISDWELLTNNIWQTSSKDIIVSESELLYNPDFVTDLSSWNIWVDNSSGAFATMNRTTEPDEYLSDLAAVKIYCEKSGQRPFGIQFVTSAYTIKPDTWYRFSFYAKASKEFQVPPNNIWLMENTSPWEKYSANSRNINIDTQWNEYEIIFESTAQSSNTEINFALGTYIPDNTYLYVDSCSFKELENDPDFIKHDIGNIIFNNEAFCGVKMKNKTDMHNQGDFWYDTVSMKLKICSATNPALYYSNIELAVNKHIINQQNKSYNIIENLDLRYGAAHGISCGYNTHHTFIRDVDFSFIGGGYLAGYGDGQVRFGNGVEFWNESSYNIVERCTFNEIYDAATTIQGKDEYTGFESHHIWFRNNIIRNSEWSFELWGRGEKSYIHHIFFEHNTCLNAGYGWGHAQRPDPYGAHLRISDFLAKTDSILIRNNIFLESSDYGMCFFTSLDEMKKVKVDYNSWFESSGDIARIGNTFYDFKTDWESFQTISGFNDHSVIEEPLLKPDFSLNEGSPCINAGIFSPYVSEDYTGLPRPSGSASDIGAFEIQQPTKITNFDQNEKIKIYPNPAKDFIKVNITEKATVEILSMQGQLLKKKQLSPTQNSITVNELTLGSYMVKITCNAEVHSEILIIE
jgi:hypothetical protein